MLKNTKGNIPYIHGTGFARKTAIGFSTSELLTTVALLSAIVGLAVPSYHDAIEKRKITNGAEQIAAFVTTAQSESIKRNRLLTISYSWEQDGSWCIGTVLGNTACNCTVTDVQAPDYCAIDSAPWVLRDTDVQAKHLIGSVSGDGAYAFDPVRGLFLDTSDELVLGLNSGDGEFLMNLSVIKTGEVSICLPEGSGDISGFKTCNQEL